MEELEMIADLCRKHDVIVVSDEVYEWLVYPPHRHIRIGTYTILSVQFLIVCFLVKSIDDSIILVATVILVLVLIRFQKHNYSFNSVLVWKIILVLVLVNNWQ